MTDLSRRERQILDILYARGSATAAEVKDALPDPPSYSTVRALLRILEEKGHARHGAQGPPLCPDAHRQNIFRRFSRAGRRGAR
jgi:hypothetical protein